MRKFRLYMLIYLKINSGAFVSNSLIVYSLSKTNAPVTILDMPVSICSIDVVLQVLSFEVVKTPLINYSIILSIEIASFFILLIPCA